LKKKGLFRAGLRGRLGGGKEKGNFQYITCSPVHPHFLFDEVFGRRYYRSPNCDPEAGLVWRGMRGQSVFS
jgi:hypothetical protein